MAIAIFVALILFIAFFYFVLNEKCLHTIVRLLLSIKCDSEFNQKKFVDGQAVKEKNRRLNMIPSEKVTESWLIMIIANEIEI